MAKISLSKEEWDTLLVDIKKAKDFEKVLLWRDLLGKLNYKIK